MSYIFYDTETTGLDTFFDQILQFAAIKTDEEFNEIDRLETRCRLLPHIVPSPTALHITGVTIEQLIDANLPSHYEMIQAIKNKLEKWTPSIFIGWNSLRFDEELLRQAFYQNLLSPYLTNTNRNCRADALPIIMAASQYEESNIVIPKINNKPTFKLDQIAPANGMKDHNAHDAMGDVLATISMCKLISNNVPDCWSNAIRFSQKAAVNEFINEQNYYALTAVYFGRTYNYIVTTLGQRPGYDSQFYVFDLSIDPIELNSMNNNELVSRLSNRPKPVRKIKTNSSPILNYEDDLPKFIRDKFPGSDEIESRSNYINDNPEFAERLISLVELNQEAYPESEHIEKQIYNGFMNEQDSANAEKIHASSWNDCTSMIEDFSDNKFKVLAKRLIYYESPESFSQKERMGIEKDIARRQLGIEVDSPEWNILPNAIKEVDDLIKVNTNSDIGHLESIRRFLIEKQKTALSIIES